MVAEAQPQASTLRLRNPGSHWEADYDRRAHDWIVLLEPHGAHNVLAAFTIDDRDAAVTHVKVTSAVGKPRLNSVQAAMIAFRQPKIRAWLGAVHERQPHLDARRPSHLDGRLLRRGRPGGRGAHRRLHREPVRGLDGPAGGLAARPRPAAGVRPQGQCRLRALADVRPLPGRPDRLAAAAFDAHARPGGGAVVRRVAVRLQQGQHLLVDAR